MSFLDLMACGLGAVLLLLMILGSTIRTGSLAPSFDEDDTPPVAAGNPLTLTMEWEGSQAPILAAFPPRQDTGRWVAQEESRALATLTTNSVTQAPHTANWVWRNKEQLACLVYFAAADEDQGKLAGRWGFHVRKVGPGKVTLALSAPGGAPREVEVMGAAAGWTKVVFE